MANEEKMKKILESLEQGVQDFFTSDGFKNYLNVMSKFHNYSLNNQLLIAMQNPDASYVAGYNSWMKNFERYVRAGEKAITIIAPSKRLIDVDTGRRDENNEPVMEKKEIIFFRPVSVFDISQTDGKELPKLIERLEGKVENYNMFMEALRTASPFPFNIMNMSGTANGRCDFASETIVIKSGMSELQTIKTAVHETAHARIHGIRDEKDRKQKEVEAESVAYVVCSHYGLDTSDYSFGYVASWSQGKSTELLKSCMDTIRKEANEIIGMVDRSIEERTNKINGIEPAEIEKYAEAVVKDAIADLGFRSETVAARVYGVSQIADEPAKVNVMVEYAGADREDALFNTIHENNVKLQGVELDINPIKADKSGDIDSYYRDVKYFEKHERVDDSWPMIKVTYSSYDRIGLGKMNIYEAKQAINQAEEKLGENKIRGNFLRINISYTYEGQKYEKTDVVLLGDGRRNFIDYLSLPTPVITYLHRHVQLIETVEYVRNEGAISSKFRRSVAQEKYEDMMLEWAEEQRRELNYNTMPDIERPPEFNELVKIHNDWEVVR